MKKLLKNSKSLVHSLHPNFSKGFITAINKTKIVINNKKLEKLIYSKQIFNFSDKKNKKNENDDDKKEKKEDEKDKENKEEIEEDENDELLIEKIGKENYKFIINNLFLIFAAFGCVSYLLLSQLNYQEKVEISNYEFLKLFENKEIASITIYSPEIDASSMPFNIVVGVKKDGSAVQTIIFSTTEFTIQLTNIQNFLGIPLKDHIIPKEKKISDNSIALYLFIGIMATLAFKRMSIRKLSDKKETKDIFSDDRFSDLFNPAGKTKIKDFNEADSKINIKYSDVAGMESAKREITEFVDFLKNPKKYTDLGAKIPKGALLVGPPGTGKTLLAKATAGEADVPFFAMSGPEFVEMFVGVGASRIRDLFKKARKKSPSIIFIDEIDAIGKSRSSMFTNDEKDNTLNQLLVEMDGFGTDSNVVVLAATNFPESLDPALTRPGRFDRKVEILLPDIKEREEIFKIYLKKIVLNIQKTMDQYASRLSTLTPGFSGADISNVVNEAAIISARYNKESVDSEAFEKATERVIAGMETNRPISKETKHTVAIHESGHAVVSWFLENSNPLVKITIIPRSKGALGFNQFLSDEKSLHSKESLEEQICTLLGGRIAEKELIGPITTGASDDLQKVTQIAYAMVTQLGMSKTGLQAFSSEGYVKPFSNEYERKIDVQVSKIIEECIEKTTKLVKEKKDLIEKLANRLLEKETLDVLEIINILGDRPFPYSDNISKYIDEVKRQEEEKVEDEANKKTVEENNKEGNDSSSSSSSEKTETENIVKSTLNNSSLLNSRI